MTSFKLGRFLFFRGPFNLMMALVICLITVPPSIAAEQSVRQRTVSSGEIPVKAPAPLQEEALELCFNYSCISQQQISIAPEALARMLAQLRTAQTPEEERQQLALVMGQFYALAAKQSPIGADRGGNYDDLAVFGRMDCIDHSKTTTRFLRILEKNAGLQWHRVIEPVRRGIIFQHLSAAIERIPDTADIKAHHPAQESERYVVDSWFVDNGQPAIILPLEFWMRGGGPSVN